jgi:hypothetical protein
MEQMDPASALDRRAQLERWPFRCDADREFERPELNELHGIWRGMAKDNRSPARADFDARTLKPFLRNITILERVIIDSGRWRYRVRLTGSAIADIAGDHTGRFIEDYLPEEFVSRWTAVYDAAIGSTRPLRVVTEFALPHMNFLCGEALVAPLSDQSGNNALVLGCIYFRPKRAAG